MVKFGETKNSPWGFGSVQYKKCDEWTENDPLSCTREASLANILPQGYIQCGLGSSPGGLEEGHTAQVCSPVTVENSCSAGQNCYVVTDASKIVPFPNAFKFMIIVYIGMALSLLSMGTYLFFSRRSGNSMV